MWLSLHEIPAIRDDPNSLVLLADLHLKSQPSACDATRKSTAGTFTAETTKHQHSHAGDSDFTKYCWRGSPTATNWRCVASARRICARW